MPGRLDADGRGGARGAGDRSRASARTTSPTSSTPRARPGRPRAWRSRTAACRTWLGWRRPTTASAPDDRVLAVASSQLRRLGRSRSAAAARRRAAAWCCSAGGAAAPDGLAGRWSARAGDHALLTCRRRSAELLRSWRAASGLPRAARTAGHRRRGAAARPRGRGARGWRRSARLLNRYGPTEATIVATCSAGAAGRGARRSAIGRPIDGCAGLRARPRSCEPVPVGRARRALPRRRRPGAGLPGRPELTAERFVPDPFAGEPARGSTAPATSARYRADGDAGVPGPGRPQVKIRGFRIELGEIEARCWRAPRGARGRGGGAARADRRPAPGRLRGPAMPASTAGRPRAGASRWRSGRRSTTTPTSRRRGRADPTFNIAGWNSSYTGEPIPAEEMREWVERHRRADPRPLAPRRVLEIGCGTGLLLFRVAPRCERYLGTDFSASALAARAAPARGAAGGAAARCSCAQRPADDFERHRAGLFRHS